MRTVRLIAALLLTSLAYGQHPTNPKIGRVNTPRPQLPVVDDYACPGKGNTVTDVKIDRDDRIYASWQRSGKSVGTLKAGDKVTVLGGANIIHEPDNAVIKYVGPDDSTSLKIGDTALGYCLDANGNVVLWSGGSWFGMWIEAVAQKGQCGFTSGFGPGGCEIDIVNEGVGEWWVKVNTKSDVTGWVLAHKWSKGTHWWGNFSDLCHYGED